MKMGSLMHETHIVFTVLRARYILGVSATSTFGFASRSQYGHRKKQGRRSVHQTRSREVRCGIGSSPSYHHMRSSVSRLSHGTSGRHSRCCSCGDSPLSHKHIHILPLPSLTTASTFRLQCATLLRVPCRHLVTSSIRVTRFLLLN